MKWCDYEPGNFPDMEFVRLRISGTDVWVHIDGEAHTSGGDPLAVEEPIVITPAALRLVSHMAESVGALEIEERLRRINLWGAEAEARARTMTGGKAPVKKTTAPRKKTAAVKTATTGKRAASGGKKATAATKKAKEAPSKKTAATKKSPAAKKITGSTSTPSVKGDPQKPARPTRPPRTQT
ncbi:hypothetical protein [Streptomyces yangpuensis]|uniref:hypothetical protein n=1 Tax=Streptomyces yangpuensis TaxID=1648182 RepID=UPI003821008E